jgi:hypothetical protein
MNYSQSVTKNISECSILHLCAYKNRMLTNFNMLKMNGLFIITYKATYYVLLQHIQSYILCIVTTHTKLNTMYCYNIYKATYYVLLQHIQSYILCIVTTHTKLHTMYWTHTKLHTMYCYNTYKATYYVLLQHMTMQVFQYSISEVMGTADSTLITSETPNVPSYTA